MGVVGDSDEGDGEDRGSKGECRRSIGIKLYSSEWRQVPPFANTYGFCPGRSELLEVEEGEEEDDDGRCF